MRKTTVYLSDQESTRLRRLAATTGKSPAALIREGVRLLVGQGPPRVFHSMGTGESAAEQSPRWRSEDLHENAFGRR